MTLCNKVNNLNDCDNFEDSPVLQLPLVIKRRKQASSNLRRRENRIMSRRGRINVYLHKIPDKSIRYVRDLWNTLVNMRWRWILFTVVLVNVFAYLLFTGFFLFDAWISGDFDELENHEICIKGTNHFTSYFMLGIETITTTGYGYFYPTEYCKLGWVVLTASTLVTIFIDGAFISVVYAKISRPSNKTASSIFSKKAVITLRNGKLCLILRINDRLGKHWINGKVNVFIIKENLSQGGEVFQNYIVELKIEPYGVLFWPVDVVHEITPISPLWDVSAKDLMYLKFEIVAVVTGSSVLTGNCSKSQTSYLSKEILWGYRFGNCLEFNRLKSQYIIEKKNFNKTQIYDTPLCSAHRLQEVQNEMLKRSNTISGFNILSENNLDPNGFT